MSEGLLPLSALRAAFDRPPQRIVRRLETLQVYDAPDEAEQLAAWRAGGPQPPDPAKQEWTGLIGAGSARGCRFERLHVVREPLSEYLRYELTWSYAANVAAGEDIRILPLRHTDAWPEDLTRQDFWWLDDDVYLLVYSPRGALLGLTHHRSTDALTAAGDWWAAAWYISTPWEDYIASEPELQQHIPAAS